MNYTVRFSDEAEKVIAKHKKSNPIAYKKISRLLIEISEHPRAAIRKRRSRKPSSGGDIIINDIEL
jgi:toxin YoeB